MQINSIIIYTSVNEYDKQETQEIEQIFAKHTKSDKKRPRF